jgi:hypothetical protein
MPHICTPEAPYTYDRHGYDVRHPDAEFIRDVIEPRGAQRRALYRCRVCGTRFAGDLPEWAQAPQGVTPIERPAPPPVTQPTMKPLRSVRVNLPAAPEPVPARRKRAKE